MVTDSTIDPVDSKPDPQAWKKIVVKYQTPSLGRSTWQIVNTLGPTAILWALMYWCLSVSYWLTVPLIVLQAGFMVRTFIIFHDCGHGSFFRSRRANDTWGYITGVLTFAPYYLWRWEHAIHHASSGDLDRRGTGDMWTMTVQEYLEASRWRRFAYRLARNPFIVFVVAPVVLFLIVHRIPSKKSSRRERNSVHWTNLGILVVALGMSAIFGWKAYLILQVAVIAVASSAGVWLFYVQHQFEGVYWERGENWDYATAALQGSSFYKLPKILQWFSGNIGFHHIHHLSPSIPNYHLEKAHKSEPLFQTVKPVTFFGSFKSFTFRLWDEQRRKLVGYGHLRALRRQQRAQLNR
ncbi:MAG: Fatty acid desaturase [Verrucomicrobiae bacterium]|nr:Fatty acid desaturase [Verrucomicrobiae bacterium]